MATKTVPVGTRFRLSDVDPATGRPYCQARFRDLPHWVMDVVLTMGVSPDAWNDLVEHGRVLEVSCLDGWHRVRGAWDWRQAPKSVGWPGAGVAA